MGIASVALSWNTRCTSSDDIRRLIPIIVCRFILEIRELHSHPSWTSRSYSSLPLSNFKAATGNANDGGIDRFDDDFVKESIFAMFGSHLGELDMEEHVAAAPAPHDETINLEELSPAT